MVPARLSLLSDMIPAFRQKKRAFNLILKGNCLPDAVLSSRFHAVDRASMSNLTDRLGEGG